MQAQRILVGSVALALVLVCVVVAVVLPADERFATPPPVVVIVQVALGIAVHLLLTTVGYRTIALRPGVEAAEARRLSLGAFTSGLVLRMAIAEVIAVLSVAAAFVIEPSSALVVVAGVVISLALLRVHAWPTEQVVERTIASLQRDGGRSPLREALGLPPYGSASGGVVQEL